MWTTSNASAINAHFAPNSLLPFFAFFFFLTSLIHAVRSSRLWVAARGPKLVVLPVSSETHIMHACTLMQNTHTHYNMNSDTGTQAQTSAGAHLFVYLHRSLCSPDSEVKLKVKSSKKKKKPTEYSQMHLIICVWRLTSLVFVFPELFWGAMEICIVQSAPLLGLLYN